MRVDRGCRGTPGVECGELVGVGKEVSEDMKRFCGVGGHQMCDAYILRPSLRSLSFPLSTVLRRARVERVLSISTP